MIHPFDLTTPETPNLVSYDLAMSLDARKVSRRKHHATRSEGARTGWQTRNQNN